MLFENIRDRLANDEHVTFTLLRYCRDGRVSFAGAHEDIVVCAQRPAVASGSDARHLGRRDARHQPVTVDSELRLEPGDVMVLYTDGITEAMDATAAARASASIG